ncbi:MAG: mechanosensitive ion channel [Rhizobiaceae bacterium]|nr:mechanosensitive ion channel [Rhizobiaceae bacterium]
MIRSNRFSILMALLGLLFFGNGGLDLNRAQAQFLPGSVVSDSKESATSGLGAVIDEARANGSTVIIVSPDGQKNASSDQSADDTQAALFLKARSRVKDTFASAPTVWQNIQKTLKIASPDGSSFWIYRAIGTALLGLFVGWLAIKPVLRWGREYFRYMYDPNPATTADKAKYLVFRVVLAIVYIAIFFVMAMLVALILDSGHDPSRQIIFEIILAYLSYRLMIRGVSWNVFAYDAPTHRIVNLTDSQANKIHRDWGIAVAFAVVIAAFARFMSLTGEAQNFAGLTVENIRLIQISTACFVTLILAILTFKNWKAWQQIFAPKSAGAWLYKLRKSLANTVPFVFLIYMLLAFGAFVFRLVLGLPNPGAIIAAPFIVFWAALMSYGVVIIIIQAMYNRRSRYFEERANAERERLTSQNAVTEGDGADASIPQLSADDFEYRPVFKPFIEIAAMGIITIVAVGELIRSWGVDLSSEANNWRALLDIVLATFLCWLAYRAISALIDRRLEEEGGVPETEEELGGEGGGAGATRVATLLPIIRYLMIIVLFSTALMIFLSRLGFDIGPIFAGAGVIGIAVGFGAQTLIRDIFSGAFFLLDDAFRKGEYIEIEGIKGTVERISIRSFQLRHHLGALHTIPFGEIKQLTNYSRDWVMVKLPLRVTYDTDVDKLRKLVKKLGQQLLEHPQVGHTFVQPLKSQGVYKMEDSAMIIRVKFMTKPGEQFVTRKVVYEAIQDLFVREGIHFAHKEVTVRLADAEAAPELADGAAKPLALESPNTGDAAKS